MNLIKRSVKLKKEQCQEILRAVIFLQSSMSGALFSPEKKAREK